MKRLRNRFLVFLSCCILISAFSGCQRAEKGSKLRVLLDIMRNDPQVVNSALEKQNIPPFLEYLTGLHPDEIEIETFSPNAAERKIEIAALRTEIMAGGGPDVFLLTAAVPGWEQSGNGQTEALPAQQEPLFPDPEGSMYNGLFLPLDAYLEHSEFFDESLLNQTVLKAGRTEQGQILLPLTFTFPVAICAKEDWNLPENLPTSWDEATAEAQGIQNAYSVGAWAQFSDLFGELADRSTETLCITESELLQRVHEALQISNHSLIDDLSQADTEKSKTTRSLDLTFLGKGERRTPQSSIPFPADRYNGFLALTHLDYLDLADWETGCYDSRREKEDGAQTIFPVYNTDGGVTAGITAYACINRNTKRPGDAFKVIDFLFCKDVQGSGVVTDRQDDSRVYQSLVLHDCYGVPVRNDLLANADSAFVQRYLAFGENSGNGDKALFSQYTALRNEVTHARFYGTLDQELQAMYEACLEAENDEEIEKIVSKAYDTMLMILAES